MQYGPVSHYSPCVQSAIKFSEYNQNRNVRMEVFGSVMMIVISEYHSLAPKSKNEQELRHFSLAILAQLPVRLELSPSMLDSGAASEENAPLSPQLRTPGSPDTLGGLCVASLYEGQKRVQIRACESFFLLDLAELFNMFSCFLGEKPSLTYGYYLVFLGILTNICEHLSEKMQQTSS